MPQPPAPATVSAPEPLLPSPPRESESLPMLLPSRCASFTCNRAAIIGPTLIAAMLVAAAAILLHLTSANVMARTLSSRARLPMPMLVPFVERREMALIVDAIERGRDFLVVDGGNRVGKSVAVEVAAARLSITRTVLWSKCKLGGTAAAVLWRLYGLDTTVQGVFARAIAGVAKMPPLEQSSISDIEDLVTSASAPAVEPVLVVEMAERLEVPELKSLLDFAKELVDKRRGRFIFVFSPTDKLDAIRSFGSLSRAKAVHVGDLSQTEATEFATGSGCNNDKAASVYALAGGHLPHLVSDMVLDYCRGLAALSEVEAALIADIGAKAEAVDRQLGACSACAGLGGVAEKAWPAPELLAALVREHLVVAALRSGYYIGSQAARTYAATRCAKCEGRLSKI
jgi:hypothetical protein